MTAQSLRIARNYSHTTKPGQRKFYDLRKEIIPFSTSVKWFAIIRKVCFRAQQQMSDSSLILFSPSWDKRRWERQSLLTCALLRIKAADVVFHSRW